MDDIITAVKAELARQDQKWGQNRVLDPRTWITILGEEFGEVARASLENDPDNYREELIQVAAVAIAAVHSLDLDTQKPEF